jgi:hypothetical protein
MSTSSTVWPTPAELFSWFGEENVSRDPEDAMKVTAVNAKAILQGYSGWYSTHEDASRQIAKLQTELDSVSVDRTTVSALKTKIKNLEKELRAARISDNTGQLDQLEVKLAKSQEKAKQWKNRYDKLFEVTEALRGTINTSNQATIHNTVIHKIKPQEPVRFDGSQNLEVVTQFLNDVEHYVRQGGSVCPKATLDNQHIDTMWRFLSTKIFGWFESEMNRRGLDRIPPEHHEYGVTWISVRNAFKKQFIPEVAISVIRNEWHALKFNKAQVLKFNRRALELVEVLGGSRTITRENPLWDEYMRKLPEPTANDIAQQARLMYRLNNTSLTLADMMDIVADRTLPFVSTVLTESIPAPLPVGDPMDLSNIDTDVNTLDSKVQCHRCGGIGHIARQCGTPSKPDRAARFRSRHESQGQDIWRRSSTKTTGREKSTQDRWGTTTHQIPKKNSKGFQSDKHRLNTINDDKDVGAGAYYSGSWAEHSSSGEELEQEICDSSDDDQDCGGKQRRGGEFSKGEGQTGKGKQ